MTEPRGEHLTPLTDPANLDLRIVDEGVEPGGLTEDEAYAALAAPTSPLETSAAAATGTGMAPGDALTFLSGHTPLTAAFDPHEPRDPEGKWSKVGEALKKLVPAEIYKKHEHNDVVAVSPDGRQSMRWDATRKKYVVEDSAGTEHRALGKGQAYEEVKRGGWHAHVSGGGVSPPSPPPPSASPLAGDDERITTLTGELRRIAQEAEPHAQVIAGVNDKAGKGKVLTKSDLDASDVAYKKMRQLRDDASSVARELLDALIVRDGSPWGGEAPPRPPGVPATVAVSGGLSQDAFQKVRDRYVVKDVTTVTNNALLRSGKPTPAAKAWASSTSKMVQSQRLQHDATLYRGAALRPEDVVRLRPGATLRDVGIMSTDENLSGAEFYVETRADRLPGTIKVVFELRVPAGTHAADVSYGEFVLDRNSEMRVLSSHMDADGTVRVVAEHVGNFK